MEKQLIFYSAKIQNNPEIDFVVAYSALLENGHYTNRILFYKGHMFVSSCYLKEFDLANIETTIKDKYSSVQLEHPYMTYRKASKQQRECYRMNINYGSGEAELAYSQLSYEIKTKTKTGSKSTDEIWDELFAAWQAKALEKINTAEFCRLHPKSIDIIKKELRTIEK